MEYTKGEWKVVEEPQGINHLPRIDVMSFEDSYERNICQLSVRAPEEELANAHLIAAAPLGDELADAVIDSDFNDYDDFIALKELAREFKAKAKGK